MSSRQSEAGIEARAFLEDDARLPREPEPATVSATHGAPTQVPGAEAPIAEATGAEAPSAEPAAAASSCACSSAAMGPGGCTLPDDAHDPSGSASVERSDAEMEAARTAWLTYHIRRREWAQAAALVVTARERQHLEVERARCFWLLPVVPPPSL